MMIIVFAQSKEIQGLIDRGSNRRRCNGKSREEKKIMVASRKPMHVDEVFEKRMKALQKRIMMKQGIKPSLRELTAQIPSFNEFGVIEKN